jgi:tetratricopeptide (TPR) repeat protein
MTENSMESLLVQGMGSLEQGSPLTALMHFEAAAELGMSPLLKAYLGYCRALERQQYREGLILCREATVAEPQNSRIWLLMGRTCLLAGQKRPALQAFRRGLKVENNPQIVAEIKNLGLRRKPPFPTLDRNHPLNRIAGRFLVRLGMR